MTALLLFLAILGLIARASARGKVGPRTAGKTIGRQMSISLALVIVVALLIGIAVLSS